MPASDLFFAPLFPRSLRFGLNLILDIQQVKKEKKEKRDDTNDPLTDNTWALPKQKKTKTTLPMNCNNSL